jgi:cell division protein ZapA|tara:strand:- start:962 stop:1399 length:438 start_codon:yes stop_codon:yes gene_type:complete
MANINIKFNGKEYLLSCEDGQEDHLQELALNLNNKFNSLKSSLGHIGENKLLLITSITVMDEYFETKKKIDKKKQELENLTEKFKELKSLVYDYKDSKEKQIVELIDQNKQIQNQIQNSKDNFEEVIENTTIQIEQFLEKVKKIN